MRDVHQIIMGFFTLVGMATILILATMAIYDTLKRYYDRGE